MGYGDFISRRWSASMHRSWTTSMPAAISSSATGSPPWGSHLGGPGGEGARIRAPC